MTKRALWFLPALLVLMATSLSFSLSNPPAQDEPQLPMGVWARGDTVLVFAHVRQCEEGDGNPPLQTLVSKDGGKTWALRGPRLFESSFQYVLNVGDEIWLAGDSYAEGPAHDSFLAIFNPDSDDWPELQIFDGYEEFLAIAIDEHNPSRLFAWIDHVDISADELDASHIFLHESHDRGRTWTAAKEVKRVPKSMPGLRFFQDIPMESGDWRINGAAHALEHRDKSGEWHEAATLPLPVQDTCPN